MKSDWPGNQSLRLARTLFRGRQNQARNKLTRRSRYIKHAHYRCEERLLSHVPVPRMSQAQNNQICSRAKPLSARPWKRRSAAVHYFRRGMITQHSKKLLTSTMPIAESGSNLSLPFSSHGGRRKPSSGSAHRGQRSPSVCWSTNLSRDAREELTGQITLTRAGRRFR